MPTTRSQARRTADSASSSSALTSHHRRLTFSDLPIEVLSLVVRAVAAQDWADAILPDFLPERPINYLFKEHQPTLGSLSQVNSCFWRLCAPRIWSMVTMENRNNFDYLYFFRFILPRYGPFIRRLSNVELEGDGSLGRTTVPPHVADALGVSTRFDYPASCTIPLDLQLLGEKLVSLAEPADDIFPESDFMRHAHLRSTMLIQRAKLLTIIFTSPALSRLSAITGCVIASYYSMGPVLSILHTALAARPRPGITSLDLLHGTRFHTLDPLSEFDRRQLFNTYGQLGAVIRSCPDLRYIAFTPNLTVAGQWDSFGKPVLEALRVLEHLRELEMHQVRIDNFWGLESWSANLRYIRLTRLRGTSEDILAFFGLFRSTLSCINVAFDQDPSLSQAFPAVPIAFPNLTELYIRDNTPLDFLELFAGSPLVYLTASRWVDGLSMLEWKRVLKLYGGTLKGVDSDGGKLTDKEQNELKAEAIKRKIDFYLEPFVEDEPEEL